MKRNLDASASRIGADIEAMAAITDTGRPWTRRAFSPRFDEGRDYLKRRFAEAGLDVRLDAGGNLIGARAGSDGAPGAIMLGSHSDTVPDGGRFDGVAGVVVALEVARILADRGVRLRHDLAIADFLAEEVSIFGVSCIGSRAMAGVLPQDWMDRRSDERDLRQAMRDVGGDPDVLNGPLTGPLRAFLEMHIEQGPVLEREGVNLGLVTAIVGIARVEIIVTGRPDHAGTTPMDGRADALVAASRIVQQIEAQARSFTAAGGHFTATVGEFEIKPNAANVVPAHVRLLVDIRAETGAAMQEFIGWLNRLADSGTGHGVSITARTISDNPAVALDDGLIAVLEKSARAIGVSNRRMVSGAGHDAAFMARLGPSAMVFVPCAGGRSHCAEEWAEISDLTLAAEVLADAVILIDQQESVNEARSD